MMRVVLDCLKLPQYLSAAGQREKDTVGQETEQEEKQVEEEVVEKEDNEEKQGSISQRNCEVQELQKEVQQGSGELQELQCHRRHVQDSVDELVLQKGSLEQQLGHIRQQCSQESQLILSLQAEHEEHQHQIEEYMEELARAREELRRLREETRRAEERVKATRAQLRPLQDSICASHGDVEQLQHELKELQIKEKEESILPTEEIPRKEEPKLLSSEEGGRKEEPWVEVESKMKRKGQLDQEDEKEQKIPEEKTNCDVAEDLHSHAAPTCCLQDTVDCNSSSPVPEITEVPEGTRELLTASAPKEVQFAGDDESKADEPSQPLQEDDSPAAELDFFHSDPFVGSDPFKDDLFGKADDSDLFSRDPFKGTDPFSEETFFKDSPSDLFTSADPAISADVDPFLCQLDRGEDDFFLLQEDRSNVAGTDALSPALNDSNARDLFASQSNITPDTNPFVAIPPAQRSSVEDVASAFGDPLAPRNAALNVCFNPDPFSAVFESDSFGAGFADFSQLSKSNSTDNFQSSGTHDVVKFPTEDGHQGNLYVSPSISHIEGTPMSPSLVDTGKPSAVSSEPFDRSSPPLLLQLEEFPSQPEEMSFRDSSSVSPCQPSPGDPQNVTGSECVSTTLPSPSPPEMQ